MSMNLPTPNLRGGRRRIQTIVALSAVVGAALIVVGLGYGGIAPWSSYMPGTHPANGGDPGPVTFSAARTAASDAAGAYSSAGWFPTSAFGLDLATSAVLPGPSSNLSYPVGPCGWKAVGGVDLSSLAIPSGASSVGTGASPAWFFLFSDSSGSNLMVSVVDGAATVMASMDGMGCGIPNDALAIPSSVIDSSHAVSAANAWGGHAFLSNATGVSEEMSISGPVLYEEPYFGGPPMYVNNSSAPCNGTGANGTPCVSPPPVFSIMNYTMPSLWAIGYSTCLPLPDLACGSTSDQFSAEVNATSGAVLSVYATMQEPGACGIPYLCSGTGGYAPVSGPTPLVRLD
ncbi:MAG TPA: hypothetical protein VLY85_00035 [Thermoplasmata archaeon]|nr:hypothetical protein [Thermoplasmata archaeon]